MTTQLLPKRRWIVAILLAWALLVAMSTLIGSPLATAGPVPVPGRQIGPLFPGPDLIVESITLDLANPGVDEEFGHGSLVNQMHLDN